MNLTKVKLAVEQLESERKEKESSHEWHKAMSELKIERFECASKK